MAENNRLTPSEFFHRWSIIIENLTESLKRSPTEKEILEKIKVSPQQFKRVVKFLKENYGLEKQVDQSWEEFFRQVEVFFSDLNQIENNEIKLDPQQPTKDQLQALIAEKEAFQTRLNAKTQELKSEIQEKFGLSQTEADRFIQRLLILQKDKTIDAISLPQAEELKPKIDEIENISAELPKNYRSIPISTAIGIEIISRTETMDESLKETEKTILVNQVLAEIEIRKKLISFRIPKNKAEQIAKEAVAEKRIFIEDKINTSPLQLKPGTKTKIVANCLIDNYSLVKKIVDHPDLVEDLIISNQFIADREAILEEIKNPSVKAKATVPDSFREKLDQHPQVAKTVATMIVGRAYQDVPKKEIASTITAPTAISFISHNVTVGENEKQAVSQIVSGLSSRTLAKASTTQDRYYQTSILNQVENQAILYLGKIGLSPEVAPTQKTAKLIASYWGQKPSSAGQDFLNLKTREEVPLNHSLKNLPAGDPIEIFSFYNAPDPLMAAATGAQLSLLSPEQLEEQLSDWRNFLSYLEKNDQLEKLHQDKLLATFQSWYGKEGIAEKVYANQLYKTYHGFRQVFSPITGFFKDKVFDKLGQTAIGKAVGRVFSKGKEFVQEKIYSPIKKWAVEKVGQKLAEKGISVAVGKGVSAAIAGALGFSTAGASVLLWAGWEVLKAGAKLIKSGLQKLGIDPETLAKKFNQLFGFGVATQINKLVDKIKFIPSGIRSFIKSITLVSEPVTITIMGIPLIIFAVLVALIIPLFFQAVPLTQTNLTMAPSVVETGDLPPSIPGIDPSDIDLLDVEVDLSQCENYGGTIQVSCIATVTLDTCFPNGINRSNSPQVRACLTSNTNLGPTIIDHMVQQITWSANTYTYLQCVGFKRAVEPNLPYGVGHAKDYYSACLPIDKNNIQPGDNAVWTTGSFGHIAIIIDVLPDNPNFVLVAQAMGNDGRVFFSEAVIASIAQIIRCY